MKDLVVIADPGKALDDEEMFILIAHAQRLGLVNLLAVVANLHPSNRRAALAKGTFKLLGMGHVPIGIGNPVVKRPVQDESDFAHVTYLADESELVPGDLLLIETLHRAEPKSITLLLVSALTDATILLAAHQSLFVEKIERVVIMGGVTKLETEESPFFDEDGFLTPDSAVNNYYDMAAAQFLYRRLQELNLPMTVLSRHPAYAGKLPRSVYDLMRATDNPVGLRLASFYARYMSDFWSTVNSPPRDPEHKGLPARWNRQLFLESFCVGASGEGLSGSDDVSHILTHSTFSDPMALVATIPAWRDQFFQPLSVTTGDGTHLLIGLSRSRHGLRDRERLGNFMVEGILSGLGAAA